MTTSASETTPNSRLMWNVPRASAPRRTSSQPSSLKGTWPARIRFSATGSMSSAQPGAPRRRARRRAGDRRVQSHPPRRCRRCFSSGTRAQRRKLSAAVLEWTLDKSILREWRKYSVYRQEAGTLPFDRVRPAPRRRSEGFQSIRAAPGDGYSRRIWSSLAVRY